MFVSANQCLATNVAMSDSTNTFDNFELLLEKSATKRPSAIYNTNQHTKISTIKPQDVLNSVYSQIKTIQLADGRSNIVGKKLSGVKSSFLAVNKLPEYKEVSITPITISNQIHIKIVKVGTYTAHYFVGWLEGRP